MEMLEIEILGQLGFADPYAYSKGFKERNVKKK